MDENCSSTRWHRFPTFDPNAAQNVENKGQSRNSLSTQPIALWCLQAKNYFEHQNSASERIWSCLINKEEFVATYIETFAEQQPMYPPEI